MCYLSNEVVNGCLIVYHHGRAFSLDNAAPFEFYWYVEIININECTVIIEADFYSLGAVRFYVIFFIHVQERYGRRVLSECILKF